MKQEQNMRNRIVCAAAMAALLSAVAPLSAQAIEVLRGGDLETVRTGAAGIAVLRGNPGQAAPTSSTPDSLGDEAWVVAGDTLWVLSDHGHELVACDLRKTSTVGRSAINCRSQEFRNSLID